MLRFIAIAVFAAAATSPVAKPTARELYNEGLDKMRLKDFREAERSFIDAARSNNDAVQPVATYNLGHVRFLQGEETLAGQGNRQQLLSSNEAVSAVAEEVLRSGNKALKESEEVQELIAAYNEARATRKSLRASGKETTRAFDLLGSALGRWRKSVDNFRSAHELDPANSDASFNAGVVEMHIAEQLKFQKQLQENGDGMTQKRKELTELMKKLRGKIPKEFQRETEGEGDEEDEEEEEKEGKGEKEKEQKGKQEQRLGGDRELDPEILKMLKEKIQPRTMSPGNDPGEEFGNLPGERGMGPGNSRKLRGRDW